MRAEEIFDGADTHSRDVERVVAAMEEIAKVAARNASSVEDVVATSKNQAESMREMVQSSSSLTDLSETLRGVLQRFETGRKPTAEARG